MLHPPKIPNRIDPPLPPEFHQPPSSKFLHRVLSFKLHLPANSNFRGKRDSRENTAVNILLNEWPIKRPVGGAARLNQSYSQRLFYRREWRSVSRRCRRGGRFSGCATRGFSSFVRGIITRATIIRNRATGDGGSGENK